MKYIIELKDDVQVVQKVGVTENGNAFVMNFYKDQLEELTADYINENFGDLQDTAYRKGRESVFHELEISGSQKGESADDAYQRGLEEGKKATWGLVADASSAEYQRGLNAAWECARKLFSSMADSDIEKAFPTEWNNGGFHALINLQPQEAIAKLKAYEEKQKADDKIEVGDEVNVDGGVNDGMNGIVTKIFNNDYFYIMWSDGSGGAWHREHIVKTGRRFDIEKILEDMCK